MDLRNLSFHAAIQALPPAAKLPPPQPPGGVVRILLGEGAEPRRCLTVPAGSVVAVDLAAETVAHAVGVHVPEEGRALHHDSTVTTPSDRRDWNGMPPFQRAPERAVTVRINLNASPLREALARFIKGAKAELDRAAKASVRMPRP